MPDVHPRRSGLIGVLVGEARAVLRGVLLLIGFGVVSWPFGGPFHLIHDLVHLFVWLVSTAVSWTGAPEGR